MQPSVPEARPAPRRRRWLGVMLALALLAAVLGAGAGYLMLVGRDPVRDAHALLDPPFGGKEQVNILVIGVDSDRPPRRSDTLILGTLDLASRYAAMLSIPRDLRVEIPGHDTEKINSAYTLGGADLARQTVTERFGVPVDYTLAITIPALVQLVDALGGVDIDVDRRMVYRDRSQKLDINLQPGPQHLTGYQAMGYVRFRHDALGDLKRIQRQQDFIRQVAAQATSPAQWPRLPRLADIVLKNVDTDLTLKDLMALARFVRDSEPGSIKTATLPGTPLDLHGVSYLDPDWTGIAAVVQEVIYRKGGLVEVLHSPGLETAGQQVARELEDDGFRVAGVAPAERAVDRTLVVSHRDYEDGAGRVRRLLRCALEHSRQGTSPDVDITVFLGPDFAGLRQRASKS